MADQAQGLRALADQARRKEQRKHTALVTPPSTARILAVTSGKGGVGKTNFSTNLAVLLAQAGKRVVVLDADLGLANVHVLLGLTPPYALGHLLRGERTIQEILYPVPYGFQIVAGASDIAELLEIEPEQRQRVLLSLRTLDDLADVILIDTGAGLSRNVRAFLSAAEEIILLTTPEPTAIADAYITIKAVFRENPNAVVHLVVNMAASDTEAHAVAERLSLVARRFLGLEIRWLGALPQDPLVPKAVRAQQPFAIYHPAAPSSRALTEIADLLGCGAPRRTGFGGFLQRLVQSLPIQGVLNGRS